MLLKKTLVLTTTAAVVMSTGLVVATSASADPKIAGTFNTVAAKRIVDTRSGTGTAKKALAAHATLTFSAKSAVNGAAVSAVALTMTAVNPKLNGYLTVYPGGRARPLESTLNFQAHRNTPNAAIMPVSSTGTISVYNGSLGTVDILADLTGYWTGGTPSAATAGALHVVSPSRVIDTRRSGFKALAPRASKTVAIAGKSGVAASNVAAVVVNLTATRTTHSGYLTAAAELQQPGERTSSVNFAAKQTRANLFVVPVNPNGTITVFNGPGRNVDFIVDVFGYFTGGTPVNDGALISSTVFRQQDTRLGGKPVPALTTAKIGLVPPADSTGNLFKAVVVNVTVTNTQAAGYLTAWNGNGPLPPTSNSNFVPGESEAGTMIVPVNNDGSISIYNGSYGNVDLVIDVSGFIVNDLRGSQAAAAKRIATAISAAHSLKSHVTFTHTATR